MSTAPTELDRLLPPAYSPMDPGSHHGRTNHFYKEKTLRYIGVLHIVVGVLCFVLGVCFVIDLPAFFQTNHTPSPWPDTFEPYSTYNARNWIGVIAGSLFIITGIFGVLARRRNKCLIGFYMTASVVALVASGPLFTFSLNDLENVGEAFEDDTEYTQEWTVLMCMCGVMVSLYVIEEMVSLTSLILCILNVCGCCEKREMPAPMPVNAAPARPESRGPNAPPPEI
ncbi:uncharacterized protein LOC106179030 isoform X2 [Lingula anatina]|uniref:Uncharacterized protein LOC106179030 isoform X2 n=1 Tax=Lingula anatina TaxID=7574 RepID=A0A1S3K5R8_LINAN|nr:uncharacterized protein LOC106179030 isoform X2 [Lingula anatina]|eukprot:XP_013417975.1 uncharacterized protein LOC106179030 isoform X2 [Lingula anatina]